jgi:hypothetical protein
VNLFVSVELGEILQVLQLCDLSPFVVLWRRLSLWEVISNLMVMMASESCRIQLAQENINRLQQPWGRQILASG